MVLGVTKTGDVMIYKYIPIIVLLISLIPLYITPLIIITYKSIKSIKNIKGRVSTVSRVSQLVYETLGFLGIYLLGPKKLQKKSIKERLQCFREHLQKGAGLKVPCFPLESIGLDGIFDGFKYKNGYYSNEI